MRIHRLTVEAVGPFAGRHDVDLDALAAGGLFLLEGPTGAGKSTLIDAIIFGLYGTLGSSVRDERLPSAHAVGSEPVIEVTFSTGAGTFRVRRTPAFQRPKRRGEGTTRQHATAKLWRLQSPSDAAGEPLAATTQEVGTEVGRLVGLDRVQLSQTVVLPQGRFATFLRAKPEERAAVLRDVFGTEIYQRVQEELAELARRAKRQVADARQEVATAVATLTALLPEGDPAAGALTEAAAELDTGRLEQDSAAILARAQTELTAAEARREEARTAEGAAREALDAERRLADRVSRRRALLAEQRALAEQAEAVATQRTRLAAARRAAVAAVAVDAHSAAERSVAEADDALARLCAETAGGADADLTDLELPDVQGIIDQLTGERGGLSELVAVEAGLAAREATVEQEDATLAERARELADRQATLAERPAQRDRLKDALDNIRRAALSVPAAEAQVAARRAVRDAAQTAERCLAALAGAEAAAADALTAADAASHEEQAVRARWIAGMSGSLAAQLTPGEPCTVCGATEHPAPAPLAAGHVTVDQVDAAGRQREQAESELGTAREQRARAEAQLRAAQQAAGGTDVTAAADSLAAAEEDLADARQAAHLTQLREEELAAFDAETERQRADTGEADRAAATERERLRGVRAAVEADRARCRRAAAGADTVAARVHRLDHRLTVARRLVAARQAQHAAHRHRTDAASALTHALTESEFTDAAQVSAARLSDETMSTLEREVAEHAAATARVREGLAEPGVAGLTGEEVPDLAQAEAAHGERHAALLAATASAATVADEVTRVQGRRATLRDVLAAHRTVVEESAPVLRMGELAAAGEGNARATTLSTYVLLRRFEDVVAAANDRLTVMSDGRYALHRIDGREGSSRKAGLGLTVHDHVTETSRDPHTLSGGETFYVSLCLALGLADVVTSEAGGITLDTLFIDEGFGSLDSHTLDGVLSELGRLQAGGRAVGIVSHVSELKERIADRIEVRRLPSGASTLTVRA